ncbi:uncharacterized protein At5g48480 [Carica papaya]|uniref:uncharacterized protein At5g48480 n=1 Tax=Carica papaya TaxID=3649 RepID=UPI000B8CC0AC|nr:uncharacterized protein At5g48480 [Carica papaya]
MAERQEVTNGAAVEKTVGFKALKPQLLVEAPKAADAIQFYKAAFGAVEIGRSLYPKRKAEEELPHILTAQLEIGGSIILVSDISSDSAAPVKTEASGPVLCLETEDVEGAVEKAVSVGAAKDGEITEEEGACCGRVGKLKDPFGFTWCISSPAKKCADVEA